MRRIMLLVGLTLVLSMSFGTAAMAAAPDAEAQIGAALTQYSAQLAAGSLTDEEKAAVMTQVETELREMLALGFKFEHASNLLREALKAQNAAQVQALLQLTQESYNGLSAGLSADMSQKEKDQAMHHGLEQLTYAVKKCQQLMSEGADPDQVMAMYREALANGMNAKEAAKYVKKQLKTQNDADDDDEDGDDDDGKDGKDGKGDKGDDEDDGGDEAGEDD